MKRDMDLIRAIMLEVEKSPSLHGCPLKYRDAAQKN